MLLIHYRWGCTHEEEALAQYKSFMLQNHREFKVEKCGLYLNPDYPFLGATPDGITSCTCCDTGVVEVKCPFCVKDSTLEEAVEHKYFCIEKKKMHCRVENWMTVATSPSSQLLPISPSRLHLLGICRRTQDLSRLGWNNQLHSK